MSNSGSILLILSGRLEMVDGELCFFGQDTDGCGYHRFPLEWIVFTFIRRQNNPQSEIRVRVTSPENNKRTMS